MMAASKSEPAAPLRTTPGSGPQTLVEELRARATEDATGLALLRKRHGIWETTSWGELLRSVERLAGALSERGVTAGGAVVIIGDPSPEWLALDLALQSLGAQSIAVYPRQSRADIRTLLSGLSIDALVGGDDEQLGRVRDALPGVQTQFLLDARSLRRAGESEVELISELARQGEAPPLELDPGRPAVGLVSAGTSGSPRLVAISHAETVAAARRAANWLGLTRSDHNLCHAPGALPAARLLDLYAPICAGSTIAFPESPQTVVENLVELQPSVLATTPRGLELLAADVELRVGQTGRVKRAANRWARQSREQPFSRRDAGTGRPRPRLSSHLVDRQIVKQLGLRRARRVVSAGAPVADELLRFFWSLRVPVVETYGQPETFGLAFAQRGPQDVGTVGHPLAGIQPHIEDGMLRLRVDPGEGEGWLETADVAALDDDGRLVLAGGSEEIVTGPDGARIVLSRIEGRLRLSPYVSEAVAVPAPTGGVHALIQFRFEAVSAWLSRQERAVSSFDMLARDPAVIELIGSAVEAANRELDDGERITAFRLLKRPLSLEQGEISPNQRVRRTVVRQAFADDLAAMA